MKSRLLSWLIDEVAQEAKVLTFAPNSRIIKEHGADRNVYIIKSGIVKVGVSYNKKELSLGFGVKGEVLWGALFNSCDSPYSVDTVVDVEVYCWDCDSVVELMDIMPEIKSDIFDMHINWEQTMLNRIKMLGLMTPSQRVMEWVRMYLQNERYVSENIWTKIPVAEMNKYCSLSKKEYDLVFGQLVRKGVVQVSNDVPVGISHSSVGNNINTSSLP